VALTTIADLVFAGGVVLAALALAGAALRRGPTSLLVAAVCVEAGAAVGFWVAFALRHDRSLAVAAGGLTACTLAAGAALLLRRALTRVAAMDDRLAEAEADLLGLVEREKKAQASELELTLARARADSRSLLVTEKARTRSRLLRVPLAGGQGAPLPFSGRVIDGEPQRGARGARLVFLSSTDRAPDDVTVLELASGQVRLATHLNPQVDSWPLGTQKVVRWKDAEGVEIEGLLTVSPAARPGAPAPLVVVPHGGPDDVTQERFSPLTQYFASRGYSVFRPNYRGGTGYGFAFYAANRNRFGEIEQADIESGVDALIASGDASPGQLYFGGWSWGGYITAWTIGHVHRYRAAVAGAAVSDAMLSYSLSDINHGVAAQWEYEGDPWRQLEHFDRPNPIRSAREMRTPTLILHGQADNRVPFQSSIQLYRALADQGVDVTFWAYPREDHGFVEPAHRVHYVRAWADWYDAHAAATPAP